MSLESRIEELTAAVVALTTMIGRIEAAGGVVPSEPAPAPVAAPAPAAPVAAPAPAPVAPAMPAPPVFEAPAAAPAAPTTTAAPFSDNAGLLQYVMTAYKALGNKGAEIQGVLQSFGYGNVNDVKPENYAEFYAKVEALRS